MNTDKSHHGVINPFDFRRKKIYPLTKHTKKSKVKKRLTKFRHQSKNKKTNSPKNFITILVSFLKNSSVYALSQVGNSSKICRKCFWLFIFLFGVIGSIIHISQFLVAYYKYPVVTNIDSDRKSYQEFPAVTVCNLNSIRNDFLPDLENRLKTEFNVTPENSDVEYTPENINESYCGDLPYYNKDTPREWVFQALVNSLDVKKRVAFGHQREDFIKSCKFNGLKCSTENYTLTVSKSYGNCYTFNYVRDKNPFITVVPGSDWGLELELDVEENKYSKYTDSVGAKIQIHNPYLVQNIDAEGVNLTPGSKTFIGVSKEVSIRRPPPYKDLCRWYAANESQKLCHEHWLNNIAVSGCDCSVSSVANGIQNCDYFNRTVMCCLVRALKESSTTFDCPLSCYDVRYKYHISHAEWPSKAYYYDNQFLSTYSNGSIRNMSFEEVRKTRLFLKVFFDTLDETSFQQNPLYQSSEILSQIGGQMGLWLGLSLMAFFELLENLVVLCRVRYGF